VNYLQLEQIYKKYKDRGFAVLAFPCNQFGGQEPGTNESIKETVRDEHGATFPLFSKAKVNGSDAHPIYKFLKTKLKGTLGSAIKWNFTKFLCDRNGIPIRRAGPPTKPIELSADIEQLLGPGEPSSGPATKPPQKEAPPAQVQARYEAPMPETPYDHMPTLAMVAPEVKHEAIPPPATGPPKNTGGWQNAKHV